MSGDTPATRRLKANRKLAGRPCGWCGRQLQFAEDLAVCDACETEHHAPCWDAEQACSRRGCVHAHAQPEPRPAPPASVPRTVAGSPCRSCGQFVPPGAQMCPFCDSWVGAPLGQPQRMAPGAISATVWGLVGLFTCFILGAIAISQGLEAKRLTAMHPYYKGEGLATFGIVLGTLGCLWQGLVLVTCFGGGWF